MARRRTGRKTKTPKRVETIIHEDGRPNIPTAELQPFVKQDDAEPIQTAWNRRNQALDPQLVWRGKDTQDWSDLVVPAPPLYIQEKVHPKALIDDLLRHSTGRGAEDEQPDLPDLFADFNGLPSDDAKTEFYQHSANWSNRMILGDSLQVMASLAEREGLRGQVQCIYIDPPYGIKFNSNFQWSTTSRDVKDTRADHITREPEQVKAFRDTWRDGIHSYLTYLRDRLTVARELLTESGSVFVQIGDENVHRVRALMDEVFGEENAFAMIVFKKKSFTILGHAVNDYILHYAKNRNHAKLHKLYGTVTTDSRRPSDDSFRRILTAKGNLVRPGNREEEKTLLDEGGRWCQPADRVISQHYSETRSGPITIRGRVIVPRSNAQWAFDPEEGMPRLDKAGRLRLLASGSLQALIFWDDVPRNRIHNFWDTTAGEKNPTYVVQTSITPVQRCILMTTDPGDLVLDPTCGSGTTAFVAEHWGRRWITVDTSRVALALARARIMGAKYPYYLLSDSPEGQHKEAEIARKARSERPTYGDIRQGFVYDRAPRITLLAIASNADIDVIWDRFQRRLEPLRKDLNAALDMKWEEWEVPRTSGEHWPDMAKQLHARWWKTRIERQREIDASIAANTDYEYLFDRPNEDKHRVRVSGPFTVESLSPHRMLAVDEDDKLLDQVAESKFGYGKSGGGEFVDMILDNLRAAGVQQAHRGDRVEFSSVQPWPGDLVCAEGRYSDSADGLAKEKRAGIFVGPEFGTVSRPDLVRAATEARDAGCNVLIACAFNFDAHASEVSKLGAFPVLRARMNADLHMSSDLKNTGKGNLFVVFGEPDIDILEDEDDRLQVRVNGVDVYHPSTGEIRSDSADKIACWFIDTDYDHESFFVRHAYFPGTKTGKKDPYAKLKSTLKAEIDPEAWQTLRSDTSRPFDRPESGLIAVKVINHLGDEVMKVFRV